MDFIEPLKPNKMDIRKLIVGLTVVLVQDGVAIDKLYVWDIKEEGGFGDKEITLKSLILNPQKEYEFSLFGEGWSLIFSDPFTDKPCYSSRAPSYSLESALHPDWINCKIAV